ncbi:hypothetical protein H0H93_008360 [Arthromyces matolae]|nr:hypothetical protein H0H93_008360 [Arthromyces matolae]
MTIEERKYWSSPYLRMLSSPLRQCILTGRFFPNDFLIRLSIHTIPLSHYPPGYKPSATTKPQTFLPDGLQHTKYTARKSGKAVYIPCTRFSITMLSDRSVKRRKAFGVLVHHYLGEQVAHLLRLRVLQEIELLVERLEGRQGRQATKEPSPRIIRRLTQTELASIRSTQTIPYPGALAVLIVPPLQKDPETGLRPAPNMSARPPPAIRNATSTSPENTSTAGTLSKMWELYPTSSQSESSPANTADPTTAILPTEKVPLYNGVIMFPERGQRAALEGLLRRLSAVERRASQGVSTAERANANDVEQDDESQSKKQKSKSSHAFLISSTSETVVRGDMVGVAIALWRLRMFEDVNGEDIESQNLEGGWERTERRV